MMNLPLVDMFVNEFALSLYNGEPEHDFSFSQHIYHKKLFFLEHLSLRMVL